MSEQIDIFSRLHRCVCNLNYCKNKEKNIHHPRDLYEINIKITLRTKSECYSFDKSVVHTIHWCIYIIPHTIRFENRMECRMQHSKQPKRYFERIVFKRSFWCCVKGNRFHFTGHFDGCHQVVSCVYICIDIFITRL